MPRWCSVGELLADPDVELVVNLTPPGTHAEVSLAAMAAGKHVYGEKPLAVAREDGEAIVVEASKRGVMVGCAPDTFLGGGIQTCRKLIDDGQIGRPIAATAFMLNHGHEHWHPAPAFFYQNGGGPMFDMGPYYLTTLIALLGPVRRVSGSHGSGFAERTITSAPLSGQTVEVEVPTHVAGVLDFQNGAIGTIVTSFDVWASRAPRIEILRHGGHARRARPQYVQRAGGAAAGTGRVARGVADPSRRRSRPGRRRDGCGVAKRTNVQGRRRDGQPRPRCHACRARVVRRWPARHPAHELRTSGSGHTWPDRGPFRRMIDSSLCRATRLFRNGSQAS